MLRTRYQVPLVAVAVVLVALQACSGQPASVTLSDPSADVEALMNAARSEPDLLFQAESAPALQRLGNELRTKVDEAKAAVPVALPDAPAPQAPERAKEAAQRAGNVVGLLERAFRCAGHDKQFPREAANRTAAALIVAAGAASVVPELEQITPEAWAAKQPQIYDLAMPLVRVGHTLPVVLATSFQSGRNRFVIEACR